MKSGFRSFLRAVIAAVLLAIGWLGTCPAAAGTPPPMGAHSFAYDGHHYPEVRAYTTTQRGPPTSPALHTAYDADDHRSREALAGPDGATSPTRYTPAVTVAQGAASTTTTDRYVRLADRAFCALDRGSVAAKSADEVADIGHAGLRHQFPNTLARRSQFFDDIDLGALSSRTKGMDGFLQPNGNTRYVLRHPGGVGVDRTTGVPTDVFTVIRRLDGSVVTMFPGTSPMG